MARPTSNPVTISGIPTETINRPRNSLSKIKLSGVTESSANTYIGCSVDVSAPSNLKVLADYDKVIVCMSSHKTTENIAITNEFTISIGDADHVVECDYVGIVSQNKVPDKMEKSGFTTKKANFVNAPVINELPLCLECKLLKIVEEDLYIAQIINVSADESILDENGRISLDKFVPICYDPASYGYYNVEGRVGNAFSDGKKLM